MRRMLIVLFLMVSTLFVACASIDDVKTDNRLKATTTDGYVFDCKVSTSDKTDVNASCEGYVQTEIATYHCILSLEKVKNKINLAEDCEVIINNPVTNYYKAPVYRQSVGA